MGEAIRTCKRCGWKYTGWHCKNPQCKASRAKRYASQRRSRARHSGGGSRRRYAATGSFSWGSSVVIGPIHADACPRQEQEPEACGNEYASNVDDMRRPNW